MIDTIKLNLYDVIIKSKNDLVIRKENYNDRDSYFDLFLTEDGEIKKGNNAYINNKFFNLSVMPKFDINRFREFKLKLLKPDFIKDSKSDFIYERNILKEYLNVNFQDNKNCNFILQTSLSKIYSYLSNNKTKNLIYLSENQIKQSFKFLFLKLKESGVIADLENANLIRLDLFVNVKTDYSFQVYKNILRSIYLTRKEQTEKENSFLFSNKQNQLSIYDKKNELELSEIFIDQETTRFENRFLTKDKVNKIFPGNITNKILDRNKQLNELKNIYAQIFSKKNSKIPYDEIDTNINKLMKSSLNIRDFQNKVFYYYLQSNFSKEFLIENFKNHFPKRSYYRIRKELQSIDFDKMKKNNISLFDELKTKYENEIILLENKMI